MRTNEPQKVMTLGKLPFTHSVNPFMGVQGASPIGSLATIGTGVGAITKEDVGDIPAGSVYYTPGQLKAQIAIAGVLTVAGGILAGIHGYKRSRRKAWPTIGWSLLGLLFPVPTVAYALGQGYGKKR
jgi:hypothetical protein